MVTFALNDTSHIKLPKKVIFRVKKYIQDCKKGDKDR